MSCYSNNSRLKEALVKNTELLNHMVNELVETKRESKSSVLQVVGYKPEKCDGDTKNYHLWKTSFLETLEAASVTNETTKRALLIQVLPNSYDEEVKVSSEIKDAFDKFECTITEQNVLREIRAEFHKIRRIEDGNSEKMKSLALSIERFRDRMRRIVQVEYVDKGILIEDVISHKLPQRFMTMKKA
ncbi:DCTN1 [Lepeophtheirus salmonis]|uniref:DCTN1 n=1 Tax=Lepeophtheirus salmonis TaxID=72036 RepID=A0A7R8GZG2_LEPSM|nr:DCTN1 [Lepeophtheirus salmonis]CAF2763571.1 DCTN1 [Lepeophtheirus salmonis]